MKTESLQRTLLADVVRLKSLAHLDTDDFFPYILAMPIACPCCGEEWAMFMNQTGIVAEMRAYQDGYVLLAAQAIGRDCPHARGSFNEDPLAEPSIEWYRTDGVTVWVEIPATLQESIESLETSNCVC